MLRPIPRNALQGLQFSEFQRKWRLACGVPNNMSLSRSRADGGIRGPEYDAGDFASSAALEGWFCDPRLHAPTPAGRPDITFPDARVAVFIDGCFWHGCPNHYVPTAKLVVISGPVSY